MICKICGKEFKTRLGSHITTHMSIKEYYDKYIRKENEGICPICGKENKFLGLTKGYSAHCSTKCKGLDINVKIKVNNTCLQRYGATNVYASEYGKAKIAQTNLERYGTKYPQKNKKIKEKTRQTLLDRYGCTHYYNSKKVKQAKLKKYGSENPTAFGSDLYKLHMINKYGVDNPQKVKSIKQKTEQTCLEKYGCKNPAQNLEIHKKSERSHYRYNNINFDSSWELAVWIYYTDNNIQIEREPIKLKYKDNKNNIHYYFPDFKINGQLVEIKANWRLQRLIGTNKYNCMLDNNVDIWIDNKIQPFLDYCENKYKSKKWSNQFNLKNIKNNISK